MQVTELTNLAIDLIDVRKTYNRRVEALRGVNIQVGRGEVFGLLGPNGAGKSTLVKIMMTLVRPNAAIGTVLGRPLGNRKKRAQMGFLPEQTRFPAFLTGEQVLNYYGALAEVPRKVRWQRTSELLGRVGLSQWARTRVGQYSKGMARRLGLAQALINDPELLILDEPTDGLDPIGRREVRTLLTELKRAGKTIFLNSHLLSEVETICDRVAILHRGLVARQGRLSELTENTTSYEIVAHGNFDAASEHIKKIGASIDGKRIVIPGGKPEEVNSLIDALRAAGCLIESVNPRRVSLEDVFVEIIGEERARTAARPIGRGGEKA